MTIAVYPGSFDPVTNGHLDLARRAARLFDEVIMAVFDRPNKRLLFETAERLALLREATRDIAGVRVESYSCLTVEYASSVGATALLRGLRSGGDFEQEFRMAQINRTLAPAIEVVVLMSDQRFISLSSSMVREIASLGGDVSWMVPEHVAAALRRAYATA